MDEIGRSGRGKENFKSKSLNFFFRKYEGIPNLYTCIVLLQNLSHVCSRSIYMYVIPKANDKVDTHTHSDPPLAVDVL